MAYGLATEKSASNFDVGAGEFSVRNLDPLINPNGVFFSLGNCATATCAWETNIIKKYDSTRGTRELVATAETQRGATLSITMDESDPIKYALAMYGQTAIKEIEDEDISQVFTVSPGDEIFVMTGNSNTAAYNYENMSITYVNPIPAMIGIPSLSAQGGVVASTGSITTSGTYTGTTNEDYYIKIQTANSATGTITTASFMWKVGLAGTYSAPITVTGSTQIVANGINVSFAPGSTGQDFVAGDEWKIRATIANASLVLGVDFSADAVDVRNGKVRFPVDSTIGFNTLVVVKCHVPHQYIPRIYAGIHKKIEAEIRFEYDPTHGREKAYTFYHVSITPTGDDSFIGEDWGSRQIQATILADRAKADPDNPMSVYYRVDYPGNVKGVLTQRQ